MGFRLQAAGKCGGEVVCVDGSGLFCGKQKSSCTKKRKEDTKLHKGFSVSS